jgi:putative hydrolase of the HAD superfamily
MNKTRAVIFDLDDVLYPHWEYALGGYRAVANYMLRVYGTPVYEDLAKSYRPESEDTLLADVLSGHFEKVDPSFLNRLTAVYWSHQPEIKLFPDSNVCLATLRSLDVRTAIITDGHSDVQRRKVAALGLPMLVDVVLYVSDMIGDRKLFDSFQMAELLMDVPLDASAYIGNETTSEFRAANEAGLATVLVRRPLRGSPKPGETRRNPSLGAGLAAPKMTVASLADLHEALNAAPQSPKESS